MTKERRKLLLSVLVYVTIIALVAFVLFHQRRVKQRATEMAPLSPGSISFADTPNSDAIYNPAPLQPDRTGNRQKLATGRHRKSSVIGIKETPP